MTGRLLVLLALSACTKGAAPEPRNAVDSRSQVAAVATAAPDAAPACGSEQDELLAEARSSAQSMFVVMDAGPKQAAALAAWSMVAPACRDARWYYTAALLLSYVAVPIEAGGTRFTTVEEVLSAALASPAPDTDELLARIAYNAARGRRPASPAGACARAKKVARAESDEARYVCAQEALASGDGQTAGALIAAMRQRSRFLDADLVAARAAKLRGDTTSARKLAAAALKVGDADANRASVNPADAKLVVAAAKDLLK